MGSNLGDAQIGGQFPGIFGVELRVGGPERIYGGTLL